MTTIALILALFTSPAQATTPSVEQLVAWDIGALLSDTVNEGDQTAHVIVKNGKPDVTCKYSPVKGSETARWAFCRVNFLVKYEDLQTERQCPLLYRFDPPAKGFTVERAKEELFDSCIEALGESIE